MTEQQFLGWCDEDTRAEWVDGEVVMISPVDFEHADLQAFLLTMMRSFVDDRDLGKVVAEPYQVRLPRLRREMRGAK